jgi:hypothetical protein
LATKKHDKSEVEKPFKCDQCGERYTAAKFLGIHRALKHGIPGSSAAVVSQRKKREREAAAAAAAPPPELQCKDCDFRAKSLNGLSIHRSAAHGHVGKVKRSTLAKLPQAVPVVDGHRHEEEAHPVAARIPEVTLAVAFGRFQELSRSMAVEYDLPPRLFAAQLAALIHRSTLRQ